MYCLSNSGDIWNQSTDESYWRRRCLALYWMSNHTAAETQFSWFSSKSHAASNDARRILNLPIDCDLASLPASAFDGCTHCVLLFYRFISAAVLQPWHLCFTTTSLTVDFGKFTEVCCTDLPQRGVTDYLATFEVVFLAFSANKMIWSFNTVSMLLEFSMALQTGWSGPSNSFSALLTINVYGNTIVSHLYNFLIQHR